MYILKITDSVLPLYKGLVDGFWVNVETTNQAFQLARMQDAQALSEMLIDTVTIEPLA